MFLTDLPVDMEKAFHQIAIDPHDRGQVIKAGIEMETKRNEMKQIEGMPVQTQR